ncbi:DNA-binding domain-containing protein, AraC-type [Galbibacter orientalis DSM 19592]|uniref:DNA-binding domain-containing protein, AraC-type n=1 Tax=Galbibacter orientalis DSM 19592 TaxID=926559 RepID=I3CAU8_9FLAO|nr:AraC family transcriptional regulator [Galbibacter orientalis]EIJ40741.1 DNA-binding domain-containing protein, AraC-type [Galbibacter orientalis DSM 19592]
MKPILESIQLGTKKSIIAFKYNNDNFETPWHFHPEHELTYIVSSYGTKFIGDFVGPFEPEELILVRSNVPHCWRNNIDEHVKSKSIVIQWNQRIFNEAPELYPIFDMLSNASRGIIFDREKSKFIIEDLKKLPLKTGSDLYIGLLTILNSLTEVPYNTLSNTSFSKDLSSIQTSRMSKIHEFVSQKYDKKITLKDISSLIGLSEQAFSRFFLKMMGRSFFTFLNEYRINIATRMLIHTDEPISQIGFACGYESTPFFFKKFKMIHQTSPGNYRKKYKSIKI